MNKLRQIFTKEYAILSPLTPEEAFNALSPHINNEIFWVFKKQSIHLSGNMPKNKSTLAIIIDT